MGGPSGNFQFNSFGKGRLGGDQFAGSMQDYQESNDAQFSTPVEGQQPTTQFCVFMLTNPMRDSPFDMVIPFHEFWWSDIFALIAIHLDDPAITRNTPVLVAMHMPGNAGGICKYPYSTDLAINPSTYAFLSQAEYQEVHRIGEVCASMLFEIYWNLVDKYGCAPREKHNVRSGNALMLQLIMDGLKLQVCRPTFIDARTAILQADQNLAGGQNQCLIFAKHGLGFTAAPGVYVDSNVLPPECAGV
ncbi:hypothetical protein AMAG_16418 [Allomyces macrogynus ATCC 38327]|uniref:Extracellular metalloproteinase n=1 Tax=Allomyces macrogynus (strain ATCC 38327) TaxID=578462 RepID=A0A0L0TD43_ALLM3|nr:hypothetical protein AMAG_16418 [Allomyces macrogynus ATCC 38327]|eukprot:KNE72657.1 hypothetical protein AMAG_16418 [Allomyces macrogynus ATCC 38327]